MTQRQRFVKACSLLMLLTLTACGGSGGDGGTAPPVNQPPSLTVTADSGMRVVVAGDPVTATAVAVDPEGDTLTYAWRTVPAGWGSFDDASSSAAIWTVGAQKGLVRLECEVSDGVNPAVVKQSLELEVGTAVPAGSVSSDTTWSATDSPFVLVGDVTVDVGARLTLEPGVQIYLRPSVAGANAWTRHSFVVRGFLEAQGTGSSVSSSIRFRGGRFPFPDPNQHQGIAFEGSGSGTLTFVTVKDGDVGVAQRGGGTISMRDCRIEDNNTGITTGNGASVDLRHCTVADNGVGIDVGTGSVVLRTCRLQGNTGPGLRVNGISAGASADVDSCEFRENGGGHLHLDTSASFVSATVNHTNFLPIADGTSSVKFVSAACFLFTTDLRGNFWGPNVLVGSDVLAAFDGRDDCGEGVAGWVATNGDWSQSAWNLDLP